MTPRRTKKQKKKKIQRESDVNGSPEIQSPVSSSGSSGSSGIYEEYVSLARSVIRCLNTDDMERLIVYRAENCHIDEFLQDMMILPPDDDYPGCVCFFDPDTRPHIVLNDKKQRRRTGQIIVLKPEVTKIVDFLKSANATVPKTKTTKFITSAGISQTSQVLEQAVVLTEEFYKATFDGSPKTPEEFFYEGIYLRDRFENMLIMTPSTPEEIKTVARERRRVRAETIGVFRMSHKLFNVGYAEMYELFEEFEGTIAANLIERNIDNTKIYQYYVGII